MMIMEYKALLFEGMRYRDLLHTGMRTYFILTLNTILTDEDLFSHLKNNLLSLIDFWCTHIAPACIED